MLAYVSAVQGARLTHHGLELVRRQRRRYAWDGSPQQHECVGWRHKFQLRGGNGTDTFFVDGRGPAADIWRTVLGLHAGDGADS